MNTYILVKNCDTWITAGIKSAYLQEGFTVYCEEESILLLVRHTVPADTYTEDIMLRVILSSFRRLTGSFTVDLSDLMNRHIQRLTGNHGKSLKYHDPFTDEVKQMCIRMIVSE